MKCVTNQFSSIAQIADQYLTTGTTINKSESTKELSFDEILREKVNGLFKNMVDNIENFYVGVTGEYKDLPIFAKYSMTALYEKLLIISNYDLYNFISIIPSRYENNKSLLDIERESIKELANIISENNSSKEITIKKALLNNLRDTIIQIAK